MQQILRYFSPPKEGFSVMTKPKTKETKNADNSGKTGTVGSGKSGPAGKAGKSANETGPIAGPPADDKFANADGGDTRGVGGSAGETGRDPGADAPADAKPRRGRHVTDCPCPKCAERRANPPPKSAPKAGLVLNNKGWAERYYGLHQVAAQFVPIPDPSRPGQALITITMEQSQMICDRAYIVADRYGLLKYFQGELGDRAALAMFGVSLGIVYVPKILMVRAMLKAMKEAQAGQEANTPFTATEPQTPNDPNQGVFKYGT
jgi:hypothetical protein